MAPICTDEFKNCYQQVFLEGLFYKALIHRSRKKDSVVNKSVYCARPVSYYFLQNSWVSTQKKTFYISSQALIYTVVT
jgi:hypothetical protein